MVLWRISLSLSQSQHKHMMFLSSSIRNSSPGVKAAPALISHLSLPFSRWCLSFSSQPRWHELPDSLSALSCRILLDYLVLNVSFLQDSWCRLLIWQGWIEAAKHHFTKQQLPFFFCKKATFKLKTILCFSSLRHWNCCYSLWHQRECRQKTTNQKRFQAPRVKITSGQSLQAFSGSLWLLQWIWRCCCQPLTQSCDLPTPARPPSGVSLPAWSPEETEPVLLRSLSCETPWWLTHIWNLTYSIFRSLNYFKIVLRKLGDCILNTRTFSLYAIAMVIYIFQLYVWVLMFYPHWWMQGWSCGISTFFINNTRDYFVSKIWKQSFWNDSNHNF